MRQVSQILSSRALFALLFCVSLWSLASSLVGTLSMRVSLPNLALSFAPSLAIGAASLGYWFYITQMRESAFDLSFGRPRLSAKLLLPLLFASSVGAAFMVLLSNRFPGAAGLMISLPYVVGLMAAVVLLALRPHLGMCAILLTLPFALALDLVRRYQNESNLLGYIVINPDTLLVLVGSLALLLGLMARRRGLVRTSLDIPIAIFTLGSLVSLAFSPNLLISSRVIFLGSLVPVLFYYIIVNGLRTKKELTLAVSALLLSFFLMAGYSLLTFERDTPTEALLIGDERIVQFFHNPGLLALVLTLVLPLPLSLAASPAVSLRVRFALGLLFAIMLAVLAFTYTRGAWLGFAVSVVVLLFMSSEVRRLLLRMSPLFLVAFLIWGGIAEQILWARTYSVDAFFQSASWVERVNNWQTAWQMIIHNPTIGVGPGMYRFSFLDYMVGDVPYLFSWNMTESLLLNVWAETGFLAVVGLAGFFAISLWMGYRLFRSAKDPLTKAVSLGLFAGLIGHLIGASAFGSALAADTLGGRAFYGGHTLYTFLVPALIMALTRMQDKETL